MFAVYIIGRYRCHIDMITNYEEKAKLRVLELEHAGNMAYYERENA